ncbi:MAG: CotH kinase family protein [Bacteroidota bacterium]|nr:CotH kinase family protein [Bacteroidota bacterium]
MRAFLFYTAIFFFLKLTAHAQTFTGPGGWVPDLAITYYDLPVSGLPASLDTTYGLESVCIEIDHSRTGDLLIYLICPDGSEIELSTANGGTGNDFNTCFNDSASYFIQNGSPPFMGTFHPEGAISYANNGQSGNGLWRLRIQDYLPFGLGSVTSWSLTFSATPPSPFSSNLPIVKIFTNGQAIPDEPKILVKMEITDNGAGNRNFYTDAPNDYNGWAGIELRGSSSQDFPKKSYGFETTDSLMNDTSMSILGMPSESDWILNANYTDKTLMRNVLAYNISQQMGHYATRWRYCEVFRDGQYRGVYILSEKIKRDNNRVDIAKLTDTDTSGNDLTGGYIIKIDKSTGSGGDSWLSSFSPVSGGPNPEFLYEYPKSTDMLQVQKDYIENFIDSFEIILNSPAFNDLVYGYRSVMDISSFIDYFLVNEISRNIDGYRISTFLHKDKDSNGGLLKIGPVWDYDIAWGNINYYGGNTTNGWSYMFNISSDDYQVPFWWDRLLQDSLFASDLKCRWDILRPGLLSTPALFSFIDSLATYLDEGKERNFNRWPILGVYVWPNPSPLPPDYAGVIYELKNFIDARMTFLDANMPGICINTFLAQIQNHNNGISIYPNPATDFVNINFSQEINDLQLKIYSIDGKQIQESKISGTRIQINNLLSGMYIFELTNGNFINRYKVLVNK